MRARIYVTRSLACKSTAFFRHMQILYQKSAFFFAFLYKKAPTNLFDIESFYLTVQTKKMTYANMYAIFFLDFSAFYFTSCPDGV